MKTEALQIEATSKEAYAQPLLTRHDALHALTGQSGTKTSDKLLPADIT